MSELTGIQRSEIMRESSVKSDRSEAPISHEMLSTAPSSSKPRVVHVVHLDGAGGGPVSINRMFHFFHEKQELIMVCGGRGIVFENCKRLHIPVYQLPLETKLGALTIGFFQLVMLLRKLRPDLVVLHGQWAGPVGALAGKLAGVPKMIYIARWPSFYTCWDLLRTIRNHLSERLPCRLADWTVTLSDSNFYQYYLRRHVPEGRLRMIPNAISEAEMPTPDQIARFRERWDWKKENCHVVSVGRLSDQKRVMWLVQCWPTVIEACPHARLWIVGDGPRRPVLEQMAKDLKIEESCVFMGEQSGMTAIAASDIVAMTSVYESRGNVAMEALMCGKPLVASDVDGIRDTVRRDVDALLVRVGDVQGFARRLVELIQDPALREKMGDAGQKGMKRYDIPMVMGQYEALFNEALGVPST